MKKYYCLLAILGLASGLTVQAPAQSWFSEDLVAYFPFDGNANDASGNAHHGTVTGAMLTTNRFGQANQAYIFGGHGPVDKITIPLSHRVFTNDFTVSVWFNMTSLRGDALTILEEPLTGPPDYGASFRVFVNGMGCVCRSIGKLASTATTPGLLHFNWVVVGPEIQIQNYHQVIITRAGTNITMYLDAQYISQKQVSNPEIEQPGDTLWIGNSPLGEATALNAFRGVIDDIRIYSRALSQPEVEQLYSLESTPKEALPEPRIKLVKAFTVDYADLAVGTNYQLQASGDLTTWTNVGAPFTATSANFTNTNYQRIEDWGKLFFRLQQTQ